MTDIPYKVTNLDVTFRPVSGVLPVNRMNCSTPGCPSQRGPENSELCYACDCDAWVLEHCQSVNADQDDQDVEGRGDLVTGGPDHQQAGSTCQPYRGVYNSTHRMPLNDADDISSSAMYESDAESISDASTSSAIFVPSSSQSTPARSVTPTSTTASLPTRDSLPQDPVYPHRSQTPVKQPTAPLEVIGPLVSHQTPEDMVARQQDDTRPALPEDTVSLTPPPSERTAGEGNEDNSTQVEEGRHGPDPPERDSPAPPTPNPPSEPQACLNPWCNRLGDAEHNNFCPVCYNRLLQENAAEHPRPPPPYHGEPPPFPGRPEALLNPPGHPTPRNNSRNSTVYQNSQVHFHGCNIIFQ